MCVFTSTCGTMFPTQKKIGGRKSLNSAETDKSRSSEKRNYDSNRLPQFKFLFLPSNSEDENNVFLSKFKWNFYNE